MPSGPSEASFSALMRLMVCILAFRCLLILLNSLAGVACDIIDVVIRAMS